MPKTKKSRGSGHYVIRHGRADDLALLPAIEMKAGALFADAGLGDVVDHEPGDVEYIETFMRAGAVHVAVDAGDAPGGRIRALRCNDVQGRRRVRL